MTFLHYVTHYITLYITLGTTLCTLHIANCKLQTAPIPVTRYTLTHCSLRITINESHVKYVELVSVNDFLRSIVLTFGIVNK